MKKICEIIAGSHLYGLSTVDSDIDKRGVFLNTEFGRILGLDHLESIKESNEDSLFFELRHFLKGLRKTNTQFIELIFAQEKSFSFIDEKFSFIRNNKFRLIDSKKLYKSLTGYIANEKRLANGERTGQLGGKRKLQLDKYGFSPKNFSHLLRLSFCGKVFFETNNYPVEIGEYDKEYRDFLFSIKSNPEIHSKDDLNKKADESFLLLEASFQKRKNSFEFDLDFANKICLDFYYPFLKSQNEF